MTYIRIGRNGDPENEFKTLVNMSAANNHVLSEQTPVHIKRSRAAFLERRRLPFRIWGRYMQSVVFAARKGVR